MNKINDLADFKKESKPYTIDIDICVDEGECNYWEVGMRTKYNGREIEILKCVNRVPYKKTTSHSACTLTYQNRSIDTLLIRNIE